MLKKLTFQRRDIAPSFYGPFKATRRRAKLTLEGAQSSTKARATSELLRLEDTTSLDGESPQETTTEAQPDPCACGVAFVYAWGRVSAAFVRLVIGVFFRLGGTLAVEPHGGGDDRRYPIVIGVFGPKTLNQPLEEISN